MRQFLDEYWEKGLDRKREMLDRLVGAGAGEREELRARIDELASMIGGNHMLTQGAARYFASMSVMAQRV